VGFLDTNQLNNYHTDNRTTIGKNKEVMAHSKRNTHVPAYDKMSGFSNAMRKPVDQSPSLKSLSERDYNRNVIENPKYQWT
jgi:hypothetical protein